MTRFKPSAELKWRLEKAIENKIRASKEYAAVVKEEKKQEKIMELFYNTDKNEIINYLIKKYKKEIKEIGGDLNDLDINIDIRVYHKDEVRSYNWLKEQTNFNVMTTLLSFETGEETNIEEALRKVECVDRELCRGMY